MILYNYNCFVQLILYVAHSPGDTEKGITIVVEPAWMTTKINLLSLFLHKDGGRLDLSFHFILNWWNSAHFSSL